MKPIHHFVILMLTIAMLALAISLPTTKSAQAARPGQSAEERIRATLEDASKALGGGFEWVSVDFSGGSGFMMERITQNIGYAKDNSKPVYLLERLMIFSEDWNVCNQEYFIFWTFHGMEGCLLKANEEDIIYSVNWQPQAGLEIDGQGIILEAFSHALQSDCGDSSIIAECGNWEKKHNPGAVHLAEALHQAAIKNGLYEPMPEEILPVDPGEVVPGQPGAPTDQTVPTDTGGLFGIPLAVILGSLGIPIAGAITGAVVSSLLSAISSTATAAAPIRPPFTRELDPDELSDYFFAGKSKEEFILTRTRANLSQSLGEEFDKFTPADQANLVEFQQRVHDLIQKKVKDGYYVKNPDNDWSIPFLPNTGVENMANQLIDQTGMLNNYKGGRCGEYTNWGGSWTKDLLNQTGFRGQDICVSDIEIHWNNIDNHGATEARFPNEIRVVVDYQQSIQSGKPVLFSEKKWISHNSWRCSQLLITPEILYDGVSGCTNSLKALFDGNTPIADIRSKFIEQSKDKAEARAIVREFYDECLKDFQIKNPPPPQETPTPDLKDLVKKLPR